MLAIALIASATLAPLFITNVRAPSPCSPSCLEADTNVPSTDATIRVRVDGGTFYTLNQTLIFPFNGTHTIQLMNTTVTLASQGIRYVFKQWNWVSNGGAIHWGTSPNMTT